MEFVKKAIAREVDEGEFKTFEVRGVPIRMRRYVQEPAGHITLEDFPAGRTFEWTFFHNEVHIILGGRAEIDYFLPPMHQTRGTFVAEEGDAYLMHTGERVIWKVVSKEPYRHLCVIMPAVPLHTGEQLVASTYHAFQGRKK